MEEFAVTPTRAGETPCRPPDRGGTEAESTALWPASPPSPPFNPVTGLEAPGPQPSSPDRGEAFPDHQVVLAHKRYGRGKTLAMRVHDLLMWRMHAYIPWRTAPIRPSCGSCSVG